MFSSPLWSCLCSLDDLIHRLQFVAFGLQQGNDAIERLRLGCAARVHQDDRAISELALDDAADPIRRGIGLPVEGINRPHSRAIAQVGGCLPDEVGARAIGRAVVRTRVVTPGYALTTWSV